MRESRDDDFSLAATKNTPHICLHSRDCTLQDGQIFLCVVINAVIFCNHANHVALGDLTLPYFSFPDAD